MPLELPADIASTIPPEHLSHEAVQRYSTPAELIKGHIEQREFISRAINLPKADAKPEDIAKWRTETGEKLKSHGFTVAPLTDQPPMTADGYEFKVEGVEPEEVKNDAVIKSFRTFAHQNGLNNKAANAAVDFYLKEVIPILTKRLEDAQPPPPPQIEMLEEDEQIAKVMSERFKDEAPIRREERDRMINTLSPTIPDLERFLKGTAPTDDESKQWMANKDHPVMVQLLSEWHRSTQSQDFGGHVDGQIVQADQLAAKKEADDIIGNKDNPEYSKYWKGDKAVAEKVEALYRKAHPGETFL